VFLCGSALRVGANLKGVEKMSKNEFGARLDRNGYAPSIIPGTDEYQCKICGRNGTADPLERHEIFGGENRNKSKKYGLWMYACGWSCHRGVMGIHRNRDLDLVIKREAQRIAMERYGWSVDDFRAIFRNNYIDEVGK
jgi:hypothetical protein